MQNKKESRFGQWLGKVLYSLMVSYHHEDYICEDNNGNIVAKPANIWHAAALNNQKQH